MASSPAKINGAQVYVNGRIIPSTVSFTLPDIKWNDMEMDGLGQSGTINIPNLRDLEPMTVTVMFSAASKLMDAFFNPLTPITIHGRANFQVYNPLTGLSSDVGEAVIMEVLSKGPNLGERGNKEGGEIECECNVMVLQYSAEGLELLKVDPRNGVLKFKGADLLAQSQANLGG